MRLWGLGVATWSARQGPGAQDAGAGKGRQHDAVGGPHLDRHGGRRGGVHREPALRPACWPATTWPGSRAHVKGLGKAGILTDSEVGHARRRARHGGGGVHDGRLRLRRRGTRTSTPPSSGGSPSWSATSAPSCTRGGAATTRSPPPCACGAAARSSPWPTEIMALQDTLAQRAREAADVYLPGLHPHAAGAAGAAGPPPAGARLGAGPRRRPAPHHGRPAQHLAARRGGAGRLVAAARPRLRGGRARVPRPLRELARCGVRPRLRRRGALRPRPARRAPVADGGGDRAVVDRGVRLLHARRRLRHGQLDAAAEEEPRRGRAGPGQVGSPHRPPHRACWSRSRACRSPTTATCRRTRSRSSTPWCRSRVP